MSDGVARKKIWTCDQCGKTGLWDGNWMTWGTLLEEEYEGRRLIICSQRCKQAAAPLVLPDTVRELVGALKAVRDAAEKRVRELEVELDDAIRSVVAIRCTEHVTVPKINSNAHGDAECGACVQAERDEAREEVERLRGRLDLREREILELHLERKHGRPVNVEEKGQ